MTARRRRRDDGGQAAPGGGLPRAAAQPGAARALRQVAARRPAALRAARLRQDVPRPGGRRRAGRRVPRACRSPTCSTCTSGRASATSTSCSRSPARTRPCVLFLDEVDAHRAEALPQLAAPGRGRRSTSCSPSSTASGRDNEGVFVLAATNHPWDVDPALRRPGSARPHPARAARRTARRARRSCAHHLRDRPGRGHRPAPARQGDRGLLRRRPRAPVRDGRRSTP